MRCPVWQPVRGAAGSGKYAIALLHRGHGPPFDPRTGGFFDRNPLRAAGAFHEMPFAVILDRGAVLRDVPGFVFLRRVALERVQDLLAAGTSHHSDCRFHASFAVYKCWVAPRPGLEPGTC